MRQKDTFCTLQCVHVCHWETLPYPPLFKVPRLYNCREIPSLLQLLWGEVKRLGGRLSHRLCIRCSGAVYQPFFPSPYIRSLKRSLKVSTQVGEEFFLRITDTHSIITNNSLAHDISMIAIYNYSNCMVFKYLDGIAAFLLMVYFSCFPHCQLLT